MPGMPSPFTPASPAAPLTPALPVIPAHWTFPADHASVRRARRAVVRALPSWCRPELADDLSLLAFELVTNAMRHGPRPAEEHRVELVAWPADGHYWLAVSDAGGGELPALSSPRMEACGGRGLLLVDAVCAAWGVVPRCTAGKTVVAGIRLDGA